MLNKRTWVLHSLLAVPLTLGLMAYTQPALAKDHTDGSAEASGGGSADGGGQASIAVRVETTMTTASGGGGGEVTSSSGSTEITVHPVCWHEPDLSGVDRACPVFCVSVLQVGVDSVGVGGGELGQGRALSRVVGHGGWFTRRLPA